MTFPTPEAFAVGVFKVQSAIYAINFTNDISRSDWTWHNFCNLLIIDQKNKYFQGFNFKYIHWDWQKF